MKNAALLRGDLQESWPNLGIEVQLRGAFDASRGGNELSYSRDQGMRAGTLWEVRCCCCRWIAPLTFRGRFKHRDSLLR